MWHASTQCWTAIWPSLNENTCCAEKAEMILQEVDDVIKNYQGVSRKVLDYSLLMKRMVGLAKQPGFSAGSWKPLEDMVDVDNFVRVGNFKEVMNWQDYVGFLTSWASSAEWECSFKRITETGNTVFLELEERSRYGEFRSVVNSVSVYEFNRAGKICHLDIYLQMELPQPEMLQSYGDQL